MAITVRFHRANPGSIPGIGSLTFFPYLSVNKPLLYPTILTPDDLFEFLSAAANRR